MALAALSRVSPRNDDSLERLCQDRHFIQEFVDIDKPPLMGKLADRIGRQWFYLLGSSSLTVGIFLLMLITDARQSWLFYAFPPFIAVGFSSRQSLYPTMAADLFHGKAFGAIIGAIALFIGAGAGIGPWLGGVIHDWI